MNSEIAIYNECFNEGNTIHLYKGSAIDGLTAVGYSAFLACQSLGKETLSRWNSELNMPEVILHAEDLKNLLACGLIESQQFLTSDLCLHLGKFSQLDRAAYDNLAERLKVNGTVASRVTLSDPLTSKAIRYGTGICLCSLILAAFSLFMMISVTNYL